MDGNGWKRQSDLIKQIIFKEQPPTPQIFGIYICEIRVIRGSRKMQDAPIKRNIP
jgi:hypothetical protein